MISVVIPNYNGERTIGACLEAVCTSDCRDYEVVVVDDCSSDGSVDIIRRFPCRLVRLPRRSGASRARNAGALQIRGEILFFIDSDCVVRKDTVRRAADAVSDLGPRAVVGGTYTPSPADRGFYGLFQSVFINYHETKASDNPDYVASHAMAMTRTTFIESGGFREDFLPIIEDVEFSHRLRRAGCRLAMEPAIQVAHIFNFTLPGSIKNAFRKARWWTVYSLGNGDLLSESGTASRGLKANVLLQAFSLAALAAAALTASVWPTAALVLALCVNLFMNRGLFRAFFRGRGILFGIKAACYYLFLYPVAVAGGALSGAAGMCGQRLKPADPGKELQWHFQQSGTPDR